MNDIEELLRESLHSAPTPQPRLTDPVATIERRAKRARAFIAGGAVAAVAVVTAAIVVPLAATDRGNRPSRLVGPPVTQPSPGHTSHQPQVWFKSASGAVTSGGGSLWQLHHKLNTAQDIPLVDQLNPVTHERLRTWTVQEPADFIVYGLGRVWVSGGGDGGYPDGLLQVIDPTGTKVVGTLTHVHEAFNEVAFVAGRAWVATGTAVWEVDSSGRHVATVNLPGRTIQHGMVATESGQLWVRTELSWLRIDLTSHRVIDTVQWSGQMYAAAGGDAIWTYDGRLIALSPALLHQGLSAAEGSRIAVPGLVTAVAPSSDGGLFVVATDGQDASTDPSALYYLNERALTGTAAINDQTPSVPYAQPFELAPDDFGGVNYTDQDVGMRWVP